ncbi:MAG: TetR/AcrR family transcriptional regulator [Ruminococcus sp.]|nr:TetR/AcrR family transcriptional regulator [Ruminococcus sp.]
MEEKKTDRRSEKTRKAIREALTELLTDKPLGKVTVQEIADKADVNRVTFYKHYLDVYDLYDKIEEDVLVAMGLLMLSLEELESEQFFSHLIDYIDENKAIFRLIFSPNVPGQLKDRFNKLIYGVFMQIQAEKLEIDLNDKQLSFNVCYRSQGCIAVLEKWVRGDFSEPKDLIIKTVSGLDLNTEDYIMYILDKK